MTIGMDCRLDASWTKKQKRISSLLPARAKGANPLPRFPAGSLDRSGVDGACTVAHDWPKTHGTEYSVPEATLKSMRAETTVLRLVTSLQYSRNNLK